MSFKVTIDQLLEQQYAEPSFDYADLCKRLNLSRSQVYRKFIEQDMGSPSAYIRHFRLEKGKEFLLSTDLIISEVAYKVGYTSAHHFSDNFSTYFGESPRAFRKRKE